MSLTELHVWVKPSRSDQRPKVGARGRGHGPSSHCRAQGRNLSRSQPQSSPTSAPAQPQPRSSPQPSPSVTLTWPHQADPDPWGHEQEPAWDVPGSAGSGVGRWTSWHLDLDCPTVSSILGLCCLSPRPLEGDNAPPSRKKLPTPPKEEPGKPASLDLRTPRFTVYWGEWRKGVLRGRGLHPVSHSYPASRPPTHTPTGCSTVPCPSVCSPGRKPAQEPPASGVVETSGGDGGWLWQEGKSLGTSAPTLGSSCHRRPAASMLGQLPSAGRARADLCWPTAARPPRPCSCVTSSGRCPPVRGLCEEQLQLKQPRGRETARPGWRDGPGGNLDSLGTPDHGGQRLKENRNCSE